MLTLGIHTGQMKHCLNLTLHLKNNTPLQTSVFKNGKLFILYEKVLIWTQIHSSFWLEGKNKISFIVAAGEKKMSEVCPSVGSSDTQQSHFQTLIEICQYLTFSVCDATQLKHEYWTHKLDWYDSCCPQ